MSIGSSPDLAPSMAKICFGGGNLWCSKAIPSSGLEGKSTKERIIQAHSTNSFVLPSEEAMTVSIMTIDNKTVIM